MPVARLLEDGRPVGYLMTRVRRHWDVLGPRRYCAFVNPRDVVQWYVTWDDPAVPAVFSDEVEPHDPLPPGENGWFDVRGRRLELRWLDDGALARRSLLDW
ncbi:hypothetical protein CLV28_0126 [Sediminihabitans luteus]|uniref:Uncharacterized protein n=1 Tax=Sediminihabitans luteus TaxID=1138585 RepID=A0A2M9CYK1_9CELL|nr:hypothetical protein [Sediminihabitans luteus]PJJ76915.1 hypothetical protein CLV28_0126 [Sediminihabitans luteus]GII99556.1 hypothetical protein Slu03_19340 [Sediminihabitans luteus]